MTGFVSDNVSGIHPEIFDAIAQVNSGYELPYGADQWTQQLNTVFSEVFEKEVLVIPCTSGTAANCLALSMLVNPINSILVHDNSHIFLDESTAPEFYTGGARLTPLSGKNSKISITSLQQALVTIGAMHSPQPGAISLTQSTETGTLYSLEEIQALSDIAHNNNLKVHMDGARFANAVDALVCSPAELTWKSGVDILSFGATKNGAMAAEVVVIFKPELSNNAKYLQKRAGQLLSKQRFLSAQILTYLKDDLWLNSARIANQQLKALADGISDIEGVVLPEKIETNMMFVHFTDAQIAELQKANFAGYIYDDGKMRICCSWATTNNEIKQFIDCVSSASN